MGLRVHRSISWIGRAEQSGDDHEAAFLFLWIAFNAAYADEGSLQGIATGERGAFEGFFAKLVALDANQQIYNAIWQWFSGPIRTLMQNRYVFNPFWQFHNGVMAMTTGKRVSMLPPAVSRRLFNPQIRPVC